MSGDHSPPDIAGYISPRCQHSMPGCDDLACICNCHDAEGNPTMPEKQPHEIHDDVFEDAHATAAGAVMGARMAGKQIPAWTPDMVDAFRAAIAEAFDAGFRFGQEATR